MTLEIPPIAIVTDTPLVPDVSQLTTGSLDGTGVFDVLMRTIKLHLDEEYTSGRIVGKEYSEVYLGALDSTLAQSVQYLTVQDTTNRTAAEIGLIRQQTVTELVKTDDAIPAGLAFNDGIDVAGLTAKELSVYDKKLNQADADLVLTEQKQVTELAQTASSKPSDAGLYVGTDIAGVAGATVTKLDTDTTLAEQKTVTEAAAVSDVLPTTIGVTTNSDTAGTIGLNQELLTEQVTKTTNESGLLEQKTVTELTQTADDIPAGLGHNVYSTVTGVVGKQKVLYTNQAEGFIRDAEQKLSKMMLDTWIVRQTTDGADSGLAGIAEADIKAVVDKTKVGIGVAP